MCLNPQFPEDLVTFPGEILNENFIFCAVLYIKCYHSGFHVMSDRNLIN